MSKLLLSIALVASYAGTTYCKVHIKHRPENYEQLSPYQLREMYEQYLQDLRQQRDDRNRTIQALRREIRQHRERQ